MGFSTGGLTRKRIVRVDRDVLALWQQLSGDSGGPVEQARLLSPVSVDEQAAINGLAGYPTRLDCIRSPDLASGINETLRQERRPDKG